jgi:hypothetical protein
LSEQEQRRSVGKREHKKLKKEKFNTRGMLSFSGICKKERCRGKKKKKKERVIGEKEKPKLKKKKLGKQGKYLSKTVTLERDLQSTSFIRKVNKSGEP